MPTQEKTISSDGKSTIRIKIAGVGGGGISVLKGVAEEELSESIELAAINTDARSFNGLSPTIKTLQIGKDITNGYGTGGHWEIGDLSARQDKTLLQDLLHDTDMLFITAGFGGGAGSGIAPVLAQMAKEQDILTVAVVTEPFSFEGTQRKNTAVNALKRIENEVDALIVIQNDSLMLLPEAKKLTIKDAFKLTDAVLKKAVNLITEIINTTGDVNIDFADIKTILRQSPLSDAVFTMGSDSTGNIYQAMEQACNSPLLKSSINGARGVILYIIGNEDMSMYDINTAIMKLKEHISDDANLIWGYLGDHASDGNVRVMLIATDFLRN